MFAINVLFDSQNISNLNLNARYFLTDKESYMSDISDADNKLNDSIYYFIIIFLEI